jgi:hypothetical protein
MEHWNIAALDRPEGKCQYFLMNKCSTLVRVSRNVHIDLGMVMSTMERLNVPLGFTEGLERINFTILTGPARGWYVNDEIWIDCSRLYRDEAIATFVHELGHHIDDREAISDLLHEERKRRGRMLRGGREAGRSTSEYVAVGFEKFYSVDPRERISLHSRNPELYRAINRAHRKYSRR